MLDLGSRRVRIFSIATHAIKQLGHALLFTGVGISFAHAQITFGPQAPVKETQAEVRELNWMNENYLSEQRTTADNIIRSEFGRQLHKSRSDIALIQRVIDEELVAQDDEKTMQALGTALGDVFVSLHSKLNWKVYEDDIAWSHAVCVDNSEHCLFPVTMLARRMRIGLKPDAQKIVDTSMKSIKPYFPHVPYSRDQ